MPQDPTGEPTPHAAQSPGIDPDDLAASLRVLGSLHEFPAGHPHIETGKRAAATMRNRIRKARRGEARRAEREPLIEADLRVLKSTATGSPDRIDDETRGIPWSAPCGARSVIETTPRMAHPRLSTCEGAGGPAKAPRWRERVIVVEMGPILGRSRLYVGRSRSRGDYRLDVLRRCYAGTMRTISQRELRNSSGEIMRAVERGESFLITNRGKTVGKLIPAERTALDELTISRPHGPLEFPARVRVAERSEDILRELRGDR